MDKNEQMVNEAYDHIEQDINDPNFHGIPGTSGTPFEDLPIEFASDPYLHGVRAFRAGGGKIEKEVKFKKYIGKSGRTWVVGLTLDWKNRIYISASAEESEAGYKGPRGFGGRTIEFELENGNTLFLQGPWHSNPYAFFEDTGIKKH